MKSYTTRVFREMYRDLPEQARASARKAYRLFLVNPRHPGLQFKKVDDGGGIYSVRVGIGYRALGQVEDDEIVWFWIGSHAEYDKLV